MPKEASVESNKFEMSTVGSKWFLANSFVAMIAASAVMTAKRTNTVI